MRVVEDDIVSDERILKMENKGSFELRVPRPILVIGIGRARPRQAGPHRLLGDEVGVEPIDRNSGGFGDFRDALKQRCRGVVLWTLGWAGECPGQPGEFSLSCAPSFHANDGRLPGADAPPGRENPFAELDVVGVDLADAPDQPLVQILAVEKVLRVPAVLRAAFA